MNSMELLRQHKGLLISKAKKTFDQINNYTDTSFDDCLQEAYIIFLKALSNFNEDKKVKFSTHLSHYLKNLTTKVLRENRHSTTLIINNNIIVPLNDNIITHSKRIPVEQLSEDGSKIVHLLLSRAIGKDYGTGKGKKLPGKRTIAEYMNKNHKWTYHKTECVINEISDWWKSVSA